MLLLIEAISNFIGDADLSFVERNWAYFFVKEPICLLLSAN